METPFVWAAFQIVLGGCLVLAAGVLIAGRASRVAAQSD
jgi:hypothetical protein